jgi:acyl-coenzyme A synthetase/AMP-(fatty) acid ligase
MSYKTMYHESIHNREVFWKKEAQKIEWFKFPEQILVQNGDSQFQWFKAGKLNTSYLAIDYHIEEGRGHQAAIIYDSPVTGKKEEYTYYQLRDEVSRTAGMLKNLGVEKGDRVVIYMPMIPQVVFAMLACARIGAIHSVVFGGFAAHELAIRIDDATPKVLLAASGGKEIEKIIPYKPIIDEALKLTHHSIEHVVIWQRDITRASMTNAIDRDWKELLMKASPTSWTEVDATDPLYILYTSGTTGVPKGIVRDNGSHAVAMKTSMDYIYGVQPGDVYWAASDVGWVVGHSYIVYAPLIQGCTTILFEGKPIKTPDAGTFWRVIEEYGVQVLFTAPTAIRAIKKEDPDGSFRKMFNIDSLQHLFLAGERTDVATYEWVSDLLRVPVIDHWWQTESGWPMLANPAGIELQPVKPGSAGLPVTGYDIRILDKSGKEVPPGEEGIVAIKLPLAPGCLPDLWNDTNRFLKSYMSMFPGFFFSGDGGYRDKDGYVYITGRIDDIINVAGHRLSTAKMEEVVASHSAVAECAVIGVADDLKGQIPSGYIVLKNNAAIDPETLESELISMVRSRIGPVASFKKATIVKRLPKTRSGKVLRNIMRAIADNRPYNPPSTIEDISVLRELEEII